MVEATLPREVYLIIQEKPGGTILDKRCNFQSNVFMAIIFFFKNRQKARQDDLRDEYLSSIVERGEKLTTNRIISSIVKV